LYNKKINITFAPLFGKFKTKLFNMKIAIPTKDNMVDEHFGDAEQYTIYTIDNQSKIVSQENLACKEGCGCKSNIATTLHKLGVEIILAGNMGDNAKNILEDNQMKVIRGCKGNIDDLIQAYLVGNVSDNGEGCHHKHSSHDCGSAQISTPIVLDKASFLSKVFNYEAQAEKWVYEGDKPAIIDFHATWCAPCKSVSPILEDLAKEYAGQLYIYKIDIDQEQELAAVFGIQSVPTFLFIPLNDTPKMASGALSKENFLKIIKDLI
jgi:thioredoxin